MPNHTRYRVERLNWVLPDSSCRGDWEGYVCLPGSTLLGECASEEEALALCRQLDAEIRSRVNPFACGGPALHYQTHLDDDRLHDWLLDLGLDPPQPDAGGRRDWRGWWEEVRPGLTEVQLTRCWQAFDRLQFHRVRRQGPAQTAFAIVERSWTYNDCWYVSGPEGGQVQRLFRSRQRAEEELWRLEHARRTEWRVSRGDPRAGWDPGVVPGRDISPQIRRQADPFTEVGYPGESFASFDQPVFFDLVEVPLDGPAEGDGDD